MENRRKVIDLLVQMMKIDSTTGNEAAMGNFMAKWFQDNGYHVHKQTMGTRFNILATPTPFKLGDPGPALLVNSHMDTVPPFIPPVVDEDAGLIKGRGACDAKGVFATMIYAVLGLEKSLQFNIGFLLVVDEEIGHFGSEEALQLGLEPKWVICGEPSECRIVTAQKGILKVRAISSGISGHSGYPECGRSAIDPLLDVLTKIKMMVFPTSQPDFGQTTVNIGVIQGGVAANVIPENASADILFRLACHPDIVRQKLRQLETESLTFEILSSVDPTKFSNIPSFDGVPVAYGTDLPTLMQFSSKPTPILYGPGSIMVAHTEREVIAFAEIDRALTDYQIIIRHLLRPV